MLSTGLHFASESTGLLQWSKSELQEHSLRRTYLPRAPRRHLGSDGRGKITGSSRLPRHARGASLRQAEDVRRRADPVHQPSIHRAGTERASV